MKNYYNEEEENWEVWEEKPLTGYLDEIEYFTKYPPKELTEEEKIKNLLKEKLDTLNNNFNTYKESSSTYFISSLGFKVDGNTTARINISALVETMVTKNEPYKNFMDFDNNIHSLSLAQMQTLNQEIRDFGEVMYSKKWIIRNTLESCTTLKCLEETMWDEDFNLISI